MLRDAGLRGFWSGYFAQRAAPLGPVGPGVVTAAFYNFHPDMVARAVPGCWDAVEPEQLCAVRARAAADALGALCSTEARTGLVGALPLLRRAADAAGTEGRVLAGANRGVWPRITGALDGDRIAEAWQACTTLREHRGDGHVVSLVTQGVGGLGSHVLAAGAKGIPVELLRDNRGYEEADWQRAVGTLGGQGLLHGNGRVTDTGRTLHAAIESRTDELAAPPYDGLSNGALDDLLGALRVCARDVAASGVLPYPNPMGLPPA